MIIGESTGKTLTTRVDYVVDYLGSVTARADSSGNIVTTNRYKPYGTLLSGNALVSGQYAWTGNTGSRHSGVAYAEQYNRARHYSSITSQWTTRDPLWPDESAYGYVNGNPVSWTDSSGRRPNQYKDCLARTKRYCDLAEKKGGENYGYNCFCKVSGLVCGFIVGSSIVPPPLGAALKLCQPWAECVNKCLFECINNRVGCSPSSTSCWDRVWTAGAAGFGIQSSPCLQIECPFMDDQEPDPDRHEKCCRSMVFCEQEQLGFCQNKACGNLDQLIGGLTCSKIFEKAARLFGFDFPFSGNDSERQSAAFRLCCKRKVWK